MPTAGTGSERAGVMVVEIGILSSVSDVTLDAGTMARLVEGAGFESLFLGEHSHIPAGQQSSYPGGDGGLPAGYERTLDLFVVLTQAALATTQLRVGSGICQVVQRDPIHTAKAVASIDHVSGGRVVLITGSSWNLEEMRNHGTDPSTRYELLEERVLAMRQIWADDEASFHGRFVDFERIWSWPKPVQQPMPVFVGGNSEGSEDRALRVGTGWAPIHQPGVPERVRAFTERVAAEGRECAVIAVGGEPSPELLHSYEQAGAARWLHGVAMPTSEGELEGELERLLEVWREYVGG
ncbi:MAG: LLM class F420-dependent oxidoreductase [Actinomycetota bacterium]|nr:LLM class F420-dependent oxidoreductase [Actinomycetota bacterium]